MAPISMDEHFYNIDQLELHFGRSVKLRFRNNSILDINTGKVYIEFYGRIHPLQAFKLCKEWYVDKVRVKKVRYR